MKIIHKTKKYLHVRLSPEELVLLEQAINKDAADKQKELDELKYAEWFFTNHREVVWQDEYSSWNSCWKNIHTGQTVQNHSGLLIMKYRGRFANLIKKNKGV